MTRPDPLVTPPLLRPAGAPDAPAITWRGETWTYAELAARIASAPRAPVTDISRMTVPDALVCCFAAAEADDAVLVSAPDLPRVTVAAVPAGTWLIASTSGTSGHPRIICRTAGSWAASVAPLAAAAGLDATDRVALTGPLHATLHLHAAVHTLAIGAHLVDDVAAATAVHCVPAVLESLLGGSLGASPGSSLDPALSSSQGDSPAVPLDPAPGPSSGLTLAASLRASPELRTVVVAGSVLPDAVAERAAGHGVTVVEYYGAAETSFIALRRWPDPLLRPFPGAELRTDLGGALWVRSPYLALGYGATDEGVGGMASGGVGDPTDAASDADRTTAGDPATGAVIRAVDDWACGAPTGSANDLSDNGSRVRPLRSTADGFVTVGDLVSTPPGGPMDGITVRGRGSSAITVGGFTVQAEDVEAVLQAVPGVRAAAVVGQPHPRLGQIVVAVVELDGTRTLAEVRAAARGQFSGLARPRRYVELTPLPRTPSGKIARAQVAALLAESEPDSRT